MCDSRAKEIVQGIDEEEPSEIEIDLKVKSKKRAPTENRNKHVECDVCLHKMRSDNLNVICYNIKNYIL